MVWAEIGDQGQVNYWSRDQGDKAKGEDGGYFTTKAELQFLLSSQGVRIVYLSVSASVCHEAGEEQVYVSVCLEWLAELSISSHVYFSGIH